MILNVSDSNEVGPILLLKMTLLELDFLSAITAFTSGRNICLHVQKLQQTSDNW